MLDKGNHVPVGYKEINCHLIFNVKMYLTRKARYVSGWHIANPPLSITYDSMVSCYSVRLAFLIPAFNDLDILSGDIQNAYLNAPTKEKLFFCAGADCKSDQGKVLVTVRALY